LHKAATANQSDTSMNHRERDLYFNMFCLNKSQNVGDTIILVSLS